MTVFELQIQGPCENVIQVKCHVGNFAAFVHSVQNVPVTRSAAGVRLRKASCKQRGTPGKVPIQKGARRGDLILPSSQGPDSENSRRKAKEHVRGSLNEMSFPSFTLENGFQSCQA